MYYATVLVEKLLSFKIISRIHVPAADTNKFSCFSFYLYWQHFICSIARAFLDPTEDSIAFKTIMRQKTAWLQSCPHLEEPEGKASKYNKVYVKKMLDVICKHESILIRL